MVGALLPVVAAADWSGYVGVEVRAFAYPPLEERQARHDLSLVAQPEFRRRWDGERQGFDFAPFARVDSADDERSHADIRELAWFRSADTWAVRVGVRKVFWGVTESQHLVDIINQTDLVENPDGVEKLGQPMVDLALFHDWGTLDLFVLPGFRERTFPGPTGRLRTQPPVDTSQTRYESARKREHVDWALRWSHTVGDWSIGLSQFSGTGRAPRLLPSTGGGGLYDERGQRAPVPFQDDVFAGIRLTLNDAPSTEVLLGVIADRHSNARFFKLEASRRLGQHWKLVAEARAWAGAPPTDPLFSLRRDDYVQLALLRYL